MTDKPLFASDAERTVETARLNGLVGGSSPFRPTTFFIRLFNDLKGDWPLDCLAAKSIPQRYGFRRLSSA